MALAGSLFARPFTNSNQNAAEYKGSFSFTPVRANRVYCAIGTESIANRIANRQLLDYCSDTALP